MRETSSPVNQRRLECDAQQTYGLGIEPVLVQVRPDGHDAETVSQTFSCKEQKLRQPTDCLIGRFNLYSVRSV
jgi:hypothetical protein